jgi:hypothetical protein
MSNWRQDEKTVALDVCFRFLRSFNILAPKYWMKFLSALGGAIYRKKESKLLATKYVAYTPARRLGA